MGASEAAQGGYERLEGIPSLGGSYVAAVGGLLGRVKEVGADSLPTGGLEVAGVRIDAEQLLRFQRLLGDTVRDEVPSVFLHGIGFPLALALMRRRDFPLPMIGMVHLSNRVRHLRAIRPDEVLTVRAEARNLAAHHAGVSVELVTSLFVGGEPVWEGVSVYLANGVRLKGAPRVATPEHPAFAPGKTTGRWRLDATTGRRFAAVLGDYNPIHLSAVSAKALGMPSSIAHGMYLAARALKSLAPHGTGYAWDVEFMTPVRLPGSVEFGVEKTEAGWRFAGWDARRMRPHFAGEVRALGSAEQEPPS